MDGHIYIFGSLPRGEIDGGSDVDLLALVDRYTPELDPSVFSIYSYKRIEQLWSEGNPFAWHLAMEARMVFSSSGDDFLAGLGSPAKYAACQKDCERFAKLFADARASLVTGDETAIFDLSAIFLAIRNVATCFSLGTQKKPEFGRHSALRLGGDSIGLAPDIYRILERARILCTRGAGDAITAEEIARVQQGLDQIREWMHGIVEKAAFV